MIKRTNLENIMANKATRNHAIFTTTPLKVYDSGDSKGKGYTGKNKDIYVGQLAKDVLTLSLVEGLVGKDIAAKLNLEDTRGILIGNTMVAHRIESDQTGALKGIEGAKELLEQYIDFAEETFGL